MPANANPLTNATAANSRAEPADRQLQRALEILIAYQAFGPSADFSGEVTTMRPGGSASVPVTVPQTTPDTQRQGDPNVPQK
jgi:hypothetical protein